MTEDEAHRAVAVARRELQVIQAEMRAEIAQAKAEIEDRFGGRLKAATIAISEAEGDLSDTLDQRAPHEWEGKRVYRMQAKGRSWERLPPERIEGVVETVRSTSLFAENLANYSRPALGTVIVRLLKKDGTTGFRFDKFSEWQKWQLADGSSAACERAPQPADARQEPNPHTPDSGEGR